MNASLLDRCVISGEGSASACFEVGQNRGHSIAMGRGYLFCRPPGGETQPDVWFAALPRFNGHDNLKSASRK